MSTHYRLCLLVANARAQPLSREYSDFSQARAAAQARVDAMPRASLMCGLRIQWLEYDGDGVLDMGFWRVETAHGGEVLLVDESACVLYAEAIPAPDYSLLPADLGFNPRLHEDLVLEIPPGIWSVAFQDAAGTALVACGQYDPMLGLLRRHGLRVVPGVERD